MWREAEVLQSDRVWVRWADIKTTGIFIKENTLKVLLSFLKLDSGQKSRVICTFAMMKQ